jgi:hypothetical protein
MARIFVSYSRADRQFVDQFIPIVRKVYGNDNVWYDEDIPGGVPWWQMILGEINKCDLFIYLLSNDSIDSPYCQAEFEEALRLNKQFLPIIIRPKTDLNRAPEEMRDIITQTQWVDLGKGTQDTKAISNLFGAIHHALQTIPEKTPPPVYDTPTPEPVVPDKPTPPKKQNAAWVSIGAVITGLVVIIAAALFLILGNSDGDNQQATDVPTEIAQGGNAPTLTPTTPTPSPEPATATDAPSEPPTDSPTETPSYTPTATDTPTATLDILYQIQTEFAVTETASAIYASATAAKWTFTPSSTPTYTDTPTPTDTPIPTIDYTQVYEETRTAYILTATATQWTDTPKATNTPSNTPTSTHTPTSTPTLTPREIAEIGVSSNAEWQPYSETFDGIEMVLVPAGCFMMGSEDGDSDEQPVHEQCFDEPFWIDKTEVTNQQYGSVGCEAYSSEPNQPRNCVNWFDAKAYCEARGGRLPTEAEWEYAARGPDSLIYPWGNTFVVNYVVYVSNSNNQTAVVGSRPAGASWVGAWDMSGNVWEWTSTIYEQDRFPYPYRADDGRENDGDTNSVRVLRGGSFNYFDDGLRAALRYWHYPNLTDNGGGFRCVRSY